MIPSGVAPPTPGPDPASRLFGEATPPDGGPPIGPDQYWPQASNLPFDDVLAALNPLHHVPGVGMIYRGITGETVPPPFRILGSMASGALLGGPIGVLGTVLLTVAEELIRLGPDNSGPPVPPGFAVAGSELPVEPFQPKGEVPGVMLASEWERTQMLERGMA